MSKLGEYLNEYGYWELITYPSDRYEDRIEPDVVKEKLKNSQVNLRGWPFPYIEESTYREDGVGSYFSGGYQSYTLDSRHVEGLMAFKSGLFIWKKAYWEDVEGHSKEKGAKLLSALGSLYLMTEMYLFLKRYYNGLIGDGETLHIEVNLTDTKNRKLHTFNPRYFHNLLLPDGFRCKIQPIELRKEVQYVDVRASYKNISCKQLRDLFLMFNLENINQESLLNLQEKYLEGDI